MGRAVRTGYRNGIKGQLWKGDVRGTEGSQGRMFERKGHASGRFDRQADGEDDNVKNRGT